MPLMANIPYENLGYKDSEFVVHHFWTLLDGLEIKFFFSNFYINGVQKISPEMEIRHISNHLSKSIPKFEFSEVRLF